MRVVISIKFSRVLIVEQSREYVIQLKSVLGEYADDIEFAFDGKTAIEIYDRYKPDLVLVEAILPKYDGFMLLEKIFDDDVTKIMLTCVNNELIIKKAFSLNADYVFIKPYEEDIFIERLQEIVSFKKNDGKWQAGKENQGTLRNRISGTLKKMGIPANVLGYQYLREALIILYNQSGEKLPVNYRRLYDQLAQRFDTNDKCVERNIRHAIETAATRGDPEIFEKYFSYSMNSEKGKPTNSEFLATLTDLLKLDLE